MLTPQQQAHFNTFGFLLLKQCFTECEMAAFYYRSGEEQWIDFPQVKAMLYLERLTWDSGCLRVIPGSHRMPLHKDLAAQEIDPQARPFGIAPQDVPCVPLETAPGDMILFHHCIWHSTFGGGSNRRYIALKFAAAPRTSDQLVSLRRYAPDVFNPHDTLVHSDQPRLRRMVDRMPVYAAGRLEP